MICMKKELLVSLSDIEAVCIACSCGTQIRLPSGAKVETDLNKPYPLTYCPACQREFGDAFRERIEALRAAMSVMTGAIPTVTLQIGTSAD
jgi:hypothetical protein